MCPLPCWLIRKTAGQDVFLEYRRHTNDSWSGSVRHRMFAIFLLPVCYLFAVATLSSEKSKATAAFEPVVRRHEMAVTAERAYDQRQHEKDLAEARSPQRNYNGPTLG